MIQYFTVSKFEEEEEEQSITCTISHICGIGCTCIVVPRAHVHVHVYRINKVGFKVTGFNLDIHVLYVLEGAKLTIIETWGHIVNSVIPLTMVRAKLLLH